MIQGMDTKFIMRGKRLFAVKVIDILPAINLLDESGFCGRV